MVLQNFFKKNLKTFAYFVTTKGASDRCSSHLLLHSVWNLDQPSHHWNEYSLPLWLCAPSHLILSRSRLNCCHSTDRRVSSNVYFDATLREVGWSHGHACAAGDHYSELAVKWAGLGHQSQLSQWERITHPKHHRRQFHSDLLLRTPLYSCRTLLPPSLSDFEYCSVIENQCEHTYCWAQKKKLFGSRLPLRTPRRIRAIRMLSYYCGCARHKRSGEYKRNYIFVIGTARRDIGIRLLPPFFKTSGRFPPKRRRSRVQIVHKSLRVVQTRERWKHRKSALRPKHQTTRHRCRGWAYNWHKTSRKHHGHSQLMVHLPAMLLPALAAVISLVSTARTSTLTCSHDLTKYQSITRKPPHHRSFSPTHLFQESPPPKSLSCFSTLLMSLFGLVAPRGRR